MQNEVVQKLEVEVRGDTFYSKQVRKVKIQFYKPRTFVQTDKPIYLPGQTGNLQMIIYDVVQNKRLFLGCENLKRNTFHAVYCTKQLLMLISCQDLSYSGLFFIPHWETHHNLPDFISPLAGIGLRCPVTIS